MKKYIELQNYLKKNQYTWLISGVAGFIGSNLLEKVIFASEAMGSKKIFLEVRVSNASAIQLYIAFAFKEIGLRKDYYKLPEGREDALLMSKKINRLAF